MVDRSPAGGRGGLVLLSGGMDSATVLAVAAQREPLVHAVSFEYGQRHARELASARALARRYGVARFVPLALPTVPFRASWLTRGVASRRTGAGLGARIPATYVPARNTVFLALALGYAESYGLGSIYIGVNAVDYSGYPDCRPEYLRAFSRLARLATRRAVEGEPIRIEAPLLRLTKADIVRLGQRLGVPWGLTWSCYRGAKVPCGRCASCRLRARGFREAGVPDPLRSRPARRGKRDRPGFLRRSRARPARPG